MGLKTTFAAATLTLSLLSTTNALALPTDGSVRLAPTYPERPVPQIGDSSQRVLSYYGEPAKKINSASSGAEVWDYGTFRLFMHNDRVAFSRVW